MALPVKRRGSQTSRASWIGLAQARSSLRGVFTGRITGADHWGGCAQAEPERSRILGVGSVPTT